MAFSKICNKLNKLVNKHAALKPLSKCKFKQSLKPWITKGLLKSIKIKIALFAEGDIDKYKIYRDKITTLIRQSKKLYYHAYFTQHMNDMKKHGLESMRQGTVTKGNLNPLLVLSE